MWQIVIVVALVLVALVYVIRTMTRSAKGKCNCGVSACPLPPGSCPADTTCQGAQQSVSAEALAESARNLSGGQKEGSLSSVETRE